MDLSSDPHKRSVELYFAMKFMSLESDGRQTSIGQIMNDRTVVPEDVAIEVLWPDENTISLALVQGDKVLVGPVVRCGDKMTGCVDAVQMDFITHVIDILRGKPPIKFQQR